MLIKDTNKLSSKDLKEGRCHPMIGCSFSCYGVSVIYCTCHLIKAVACMKVLLYFPFALHLFQLGAMKQSVFHAKVCDLSYYFVGIPSTSAISCGSMVGLQNRRMKEALFMKKVQQNVKEEQANHNRWWVKLEYKILI